MRHLRHSIWLCMLVACSRGEPAVTAEDATPIVAAEPIDLRAVELDTAPASDAEVGMWVRCTGGSLRAGERTERACAGSSQTFVGSADRVVIVVDAANADHLEVGGKHARFIEQRARLEFDLRTLMGGLTPAQIADVTTLWVPLKIVGLEGAPSLEGELSLETPRVMALLNGLEGSGLRFGEADRAPVGAAPRVLLVGVPGGAPDGVTLAEIDLVGLARDVPATIVCGAAATTRQVATLVVVDRRSGKRVGERRWEPSCAAPDGHVISLDDVIAATSPSSVDPALQARGVVHVPPTDMALIASAASFLGLGSSSGKPQLTRVLGNVSASALAASGDETLAFGPDLGAMIDAKTSTIQEIWVVGARGRDTLRSKQLDHPLLAYIGQPLRAVVAALGKPLKIGDDFVSWTHDKDGVTTYVEMQCPQEAGWVCNELDVGWIAAGQ